MKTYRLVHSTRYDYDAVVTESYGRAHLVPRDDAGQRCTSTETVIEPEPAEQYLHADYFGNSSTFFRVGTPHRRLVVRAASEVSVDRPVAALDLLGDLSWQDARDAAADHPAVAEFALPSPRIAANALVTRYAAPSIAPDRPLAELINDLMKRVHADFAYRPGATTVTTTSAQLLRTRAGVCQDFAHLAIGSLRSAGLAARYVSGYLETDPPPGQPKLAGADASHAWASVWVPEAGWVDFDPTNDKYVDERYLVTAYGRDYGDVPPLKGIIVTESKRSKMQVSVDVNRID